MTISVDGGRPVDRSGGIQRFLGDNVQNHGTKGADREPKPIPGRVVRAIQDGDRIVGGVPHQELEAAADAILGESAVVVYDSDGLYAGVSSSEVYGYEWMVPVSGSDVYVSELFGATALDVYLEKSGFTIRARP